VRSIEVYSMYTSANSQSHLPNSTSIDHLLHESGADYCIRSNDSTDAIVVGHRDVAFKDPGEMDINGLTHGPRVVDVLEVEASGVVDIANDI